MTSYITLVGSFDQCHEVSSLRISVFLVLSWFICCSEGFIHVLLFFVANDSISEPQIRLLLSPILATPGIPYLPHFLLWAWPVSLNFDDYMTHEVGSCAHWPLWWRITQYFILNEVVGYRWWKQKAIDHSLSSLVYNQWLQTGAERLIQHMYYLWPKWLKLCYLFFQSGRFLKQLKSVDFGMTRREESLALVKSGSVI